MDRQRSHLGLPCTGSRTSTFLPSSPPLLLSKMSTTPQATSDGAHPPKTDMEHTNENQFIVPGFTVKQSVLDRFPFASALDHPLSSVSSPIGPGFSRSPQASRCDPVRTSPLPRERRTNERRSFGLTSVLFFHLRRCQGRVFREICSSLFALHVSVLSSAALFPPCRDSLRVEGISPS
jgi:hypothetical protein